MKTNEFSTADIYKNTCMVVQKLPDSLPIQPNTSKQQLNTRVLKQHSTAQFRLVSNISTTTHTECHRFIFCVKRKY